MTSSMSPGSGNLEIVLGPDGQLTLPAWAREALGLQAGDRLAVSISESGLVFTPRKAVALQALREIREAFAAAGITEDQLEAEGQRIREEISRTRYGRA